MLTKSDLGKIQTVVRKGVRGEIQTVVRKEVQTVVRKEVRRETKSLKADVAKIRKDIDIIITLFDREYLNLRERVQRIEEHLELTPLT